MPILHVCVERGCGRLVAHPIEGRCAVHATEFLRKKNAKKAEKRKAHGRTTSHWRKLRRRALERDGFRCRFGLEGCLVVATTVHLDPRKNGDHRTATLNDCLSGCSRCHGRVDQARQFAKRDAPFV